MKDDNTGWKDLNECCRVSHSKENQLKIYWHNGKFKMTGLNHCHKPICPNCLPILLYRQQLMINQAIQNSVLQRTRFKS